MTKPIVFISYSRKDPDWKELFVSHMGVAEKQGQLNQWFDTLIGAGEDWEPQIESAMNAASIAVLLVSVNYLNSEYVLNNEIPLLLQRRATEGLRVIPILVKPCDWEAVDWLKKMNIRPDPKRPISAGNEYQIDPDFAAIAKEIREMLKQTAPPITPTFVSLNPDKISVSRLPQLLTGDLFGREAELQLLDDAWANPKTNIVTFVAFGGTGKSALVKYWEQQMALKNYRGAERVYGWSFWSQGSDQAQISADPFIDAALRWFDDPNPTAGSSWDKGERLAQHIRKMRTLLILDGLEPLQHPPGPMEGLLKEQSMQALLGELAASQPGLCVISTREQIADLIGSDLPAVISHDLDQLSPQAGAQILRQQNIEGDDAELEQASEDFGNHALALTILASYLKDAYNGDIRRRNEIPALNDEDDRTGRHALRVMTSYEKWLSDAGEHAMLAVLRILGLFNRPADAASIAALREAPVIPGLTDALQNLSETKWKLTLAKLRRIKLLTERPAQSSHQTGDKLDAHPLVREYFRQRLQQTAPDAWRESNNRLCEYLAKTAEEFPNTLNEMTKLYAAVANGCEAGRHQEMWDEIYFRRIQRGEEFFSTRTLGAFDSELAMLASFFEERWHKPKVGLRETTKASLLSKIGIRLIALGQPMQAIDPLRTALSIRITGEQWNYAAINASSLSEACSVVGSLHDALTYAWKGVELADQSGDENHRSARRAVWASVLHQLGNVSEASLMFHEAEEMQKRGISAIPFLYSLMGFMYCDLLLGLRRYQEVQVRADCMLKLAMQKNQPRDIGLSYLSLGRAFLLRIQLEGTDDSAQARDLLSRAFETLKRAGQLDFLPLGLLARAALYRLTGDHPLAQRDLAEARSIAERGEMRLHLADCHLESARLALATGDRDSGRRAWETAQKMIEEMGYHRRDGEVAELEQQLNAD